MKRWILITVGMSAVLAVALLPPRSYGPQPRILDRPGQDTPEYREYRETQARVARIAALQKVAAYVDSLVPLVAGHADGVYMPTEGVPEDRLPALLELVEDLGDPVPGARPARVGVVEVILSRDALAYNWVFASHRYLIGEHEGVPYCLVVDAEVRDGMAVDEQDAHELARGPCRLYARYGMPGPGVRHWLRATLHRFARWDDELPQEAEAPERRREIFGVRGGRRGFLSVSASRCIAGSPEACMEELVSPGATFTSWSWWYTRQPDAWIQGQLGPEVSQFGARRSYVEGFDSPERSLLFHLEEEFGQEAFADFWRSDAPLARAFQDAFGMPMGRWVMSWARRHHGVMDTGPAVPLSAAGLSILSVLLLGAVAGLVARRRTVG